MSLPPPLMGLSPFLGLDGDMAVDDMAMGTLQAKLLQDALAHLRVVIKGVVAVFGLGPGALILDEPPLKGGHSVPAEDGAVPAAQSHHRKSMPNCRSGEPGLS